jgi:hypothetical protein
LIEFLSDRDVDEAKFRFRATTKGQNMIGMRQKRGINGQSLPVRDSHQQLHDARKVQSVISHNNGYGKQAALSPLQATLASGFTYM